MLYSTFLFAALIPEHGWSWNIPIVILLATVVAYPLTRPFVHDPGKDQNVIPIPLPGGLKWPDLLLTASVGHILGISAVLALRYTHYF
ncbi:MAG TPA: hypothetical protein V6D03_00150 [Candidatus Caenarcaniphilales bacterium]